MGKISKPAHGNSPHRTTDTEKGGRGGRREGERGTGGGVGLGWIGLCPVKRLGSHFADEKKDVLRRSVAGKA